MTNGNSAEDDAELRDLYDMVYKHVLPFTAFKDALSVCADGGKGGAVGEIVGSENLHWARLFENIPFGTKLYATPRAHADIENSKFADLYVQMQRVAQANGFNSITSAIACASINRRDPRADAEKDAARYNWLKSRLKSHDIFDGIQFETWFDAEGHSDLDECIDGEMQRETENKEPKC